MSLYYVQKLLYLINREPHTRKRLAPDFDVLVSEYELTTEEISALREVDVGMLYIMGVNGQILMHYAAHRGYEWNDYIATLRRALKEHGPVRAGLYATIWD